MPAGGILLAVFVGWIWGKEKFSGALSNHGALNNPTVTRAAFFLLRYVSPVLTLLVMLKDLNVL